MLEQLLAPTKGSPTDRTQLLNIWQECKLPWLGWVLKGIKDLSNKNTHQLFWLTAVLDNKGLSHSGQALGSRLNFCLHPKSFQRQLAQQAKLAHDSSTKEVMSTAHVWWADNYNKSYGQRFYKLNKGPQLVLNWTGLGVSLAHEFPLRKLVRPTQELTLKPMLPEHLYTQESKKMLLTLIKAASTDNQSILGTFGTSFCRAHCVTNVPLKPTICGPMVDSNDLRWMAEHNDGLCNFVPLELLKENIAADVGLAKVVRHLVSFYEDTRGRYFSVGKVDISIYWRMNLVNLASATIITWHIYSRIN